MQGVWQNMRNYFIVPTKASLWWVGKGSYLMFDLISVERQPCVLAAKDSIQECNGKHDKVLAVCSVTKNKMSFMCSQAKLSKSV